MNILKALGHFLRQVVLAIDQLFNALTGGYADETLSARAWRTEQKGKILGKIFRPFIDFICFWEKDHCLLAYRAELQKRHYPRDYR